MIPTAKQTVTVALSQVGYKCKGKKDKYAKWIDTNYPTFYNGKKYGCADWCDIYNDWTVLYVAKNAKDAEKVLCQPAKSCGAGVKYSYQYYKAKKRTTKTGKYGDQIFLKNSKGKLSHTGKVYKVDSRDYADEEPSTYVPREDRGPNSMTSGEPYKYSYEVQHARIAAEKE